MVQSRKQGLGCGGCLLLCLGALAFFWITSVEKQGRSTTDTEENRDFRGPLAPSGIETLPPITVKLNDELLRILTMTDELDALHKRGGRSADFVAAGAPAEAAARRVESRLAKGDARRDLLVNTIEGYQKAILEMMRVEQGRSSSEEVSALVLTAGLRKTMLRQILQNRMTPEVRKMYETWRQSVEPDTSRPK